MFVNFSIQNVLTLSTVVCVFSQIRMMNDAVGVTTLPVDTATSTSASTRLFSPLICALEPPKFYKHLYLNDLLPSDKCQRYKFLQSLKKSGLPFQTVLYTYAPGGNTCNLHFM